MTTLSRFRLVNVVWEFSSTLFHSSQFYQRGILCPRGLVAVVIDCISRRFYYGYSVPLMFVLLVHISFYIHRRRASVASFYAFSYAPLWWIHCLHHVVHHCYSTGRRLPRATTKRLLSGNLHFIAHVCMFLSTNWRLVLIALLRLVLYQWQYYLNISFVQLNLITTARPRMWWWPLDKLLSGNEQWFSFN